MDMNDAVHPWVNSAGVWVITFARELPTPFRTRRDLRRGELTSLLVHGMRIGVLGIRPLNHIANLGTHFGRRVKRRATVNHDLAHPSHRHARPWRCLPDDTVCQSIITLALTGLSAGLHCRTQPQKH